MCVEGDHQGRMGVDAGWAAREKSCSTLVQTVAESESSTQALLQELPPHRLYTSRQVSRTRLRRVAGVRLAITLLAIAPPGFPPLSRLRLANLLLLPCNPLHERAVLCVGGVQLVEPRLLDLAPLLGMRRTLQLELKQVPSRSVECVNGAHAITKERSLRLAAEERCAARGHCARPCGTRQRQKGTIAYLFENDPE